MKNVPDTHNNWFQNSCGVTVRSLKLAISSFFFAEPNELLTQISNSTQWLTYCALLTKHKKTFVQLSIFFTQVFTLCILIQ